MEWNLEEAIAYYKTQGAPREQSAVISLLREIQREKGGIPRHTLKAMAEGFGVKEGYFLAIIKRIPSLRLADTHSLEICAGKICGKRAELANFAEALHRENPDITVKFIPCMGQCGKGPNIRWDGKMYNHADEALLRRLMEER